MRKLTIVLFAGLFVLGMTVPVLADVFVLADIEKYKTIDVYQDVDIYKDITFDVTIDLDAVKGAEADSIVNQLNFDNLACENCAEKIALISGSINDNKGIINANQAVGNFNNQGNVVTMAVDVFGGGGGTPGTPGDGFANAETAVDQENVANEINTINILFRTAKIENSINNNVGIVGVNQSAGNINNQINVVTMAVAIQGNAALAEADLGQLNTSMPLVDGGSPSIDQVRVSLVFEHDTQKDALVSGSINNNSGIVGVNQTVGNFANQGNIANVAAFTTNAPAVATLPNFR